MRKLLVGSRGSDLALTQARGILNELRACIPELHVEIEIIRTQGDIVTDVPLSKIGDRGLFIKEIEAALLEERIDFAVHSMKDVPSEIPSGLTLAATTERLEPHDVLITRNGGNLEDLPPGGVLATGSLRRRSQALVARSDLNVVDLRGNVTTRLRKFEESSWDAMILAEAGLERLGLKPKHITKMPTGQMLPAVGQGALALEARLEDEEVLDHLNRLQHRETAAAVEAERSFLRELEGGCQVPIASLGLVQNDRLVLEGFVGSLDGRRYVRLRSDGPVSDASEIGTSLAKQILAGGGREILNEVRSSQQSADSRQ